MLDYEEENQEELAQETALEESVSEEPETVLLDDEIPEDDIEEETEPEGEFILTDEEGNEYPVTLLDYVDYKDKLYALLAPEDADLDDEDAELDIMVMEVVIENEDPSFIMVEDEDLALAVLDEFTKKVIEEAEE